jgi:transcriptional regulator with XRE-family HTH domain
MREAAGGTQETVAEALGVSQPTVAIGEGKATAETVSVARLLALAAALDGRLEIRFYPPAKKKERGPKKDPLTV